MKMKNRIAMCSLGTLGLITHDDPQEVTYGDGHKGFAYVGIHLTDKVAPVGSPWSSRSPKLCGMLLDGAAGYVVRGFGFTVADLKPGFQPLNPTCLLEEAARGC